MSNCSFFKRKNIESLEGLDIPEICKDSFKVYGCPNLQSLKGSPREVDGDYYVSECDLRSLEGAPEKVNERFDVHSNPHLQSLKSGPKEVGEDYLAYSCDLRSLEGAPEKVGGTFNVSENKSLKSLKGGPREAGEDYLAYNCDLRSLEGAPEKVGGSFEIYNNPKLTIDSIFRQKDFQSLFESLKSYKEIKADPEIQDFLEFLKKFLERGKTDISIEKLRLLWKTSKSLK